MKRVSLPLAKKDLMSLGAGDEVLLSGIIYTARDQAHKRLIESLKKKKRLPFKLEGETIYYCGPTPAPKGRAIGSCGPTTSARMDGLTFPLLKRGLKGMIGKGRRSREVIKAIEKYKAVYFLTFAGCGALLAEKVKKVTPVAFRDLGPEAIYKFKIKDFPVIVGVDSYGKSIYKT